MIAGCPDKLITAFSSRRAQIDKVTLGMVERFKDERGAEPDRRAVWSMSRYAHNVTKKGKPERRARLRQAPVGLGHCEPSGRAGLID